MTEFDAWRERPQSPRPFDEKAYSEFKRAVASRGTQPSIPNDAGVAHPDPVERMREALVEAERFMAYFSGETGNTFVGPGTPESCLTQIRSALSHLRTEPAQSKEQADG